MLQDNSDPTVALFVSEGAADKAARLVKSQYPDRVSKSVVKPRKSRGEFQGYQVINHFNDNRPSSPLTNSDFERLH